MPAATSAPAAHADKHRSPKKIHLYGRSQSQPAVALDGELAEDEESAAAASAAAAAAAEAEKKRLFWEINEVEMSDAVASIIGGSDPADFSLCISPEPTMSRRRTSSESRAKGLSTPAAADLSLRRPSADSPSDRLPVVETIDGCTLDCGQCGQE